MGRSLIIDGIEIAVVRQFNAKSMRLKIDRKTASPVVTIPYFCPLFTAERFVRSHWIWLTKQLELTPPKTAFQDKMTITVLGQTVTICHAPQKRCGARIENGVLYVSGDAAHLHRRVTDFIKDQVRQYAGRKALEFAALSGVHVKGVAVRDTISRWGSCSTNGHLSFCWRLGLAPLFVLDYVIAHEVSHLKEMNHSRAFWKAVATLYPDMRKAKKWLTDNGKELHRFN